MNILLIITYSFAYESIDKHSYLDDFLGENEC